MRELSTDVGVFPTCLVEKERWFCWAYDQGRKIPRAPWNYPDWPDRHVSWKDTDNWTTFEHAMEWVESYPGMRPAICLPPRPTELNDEVRTILIDCDNVRNTETGDIHTQAARFLHHLGVYTALSTSGEGLHGIARSSLPEGYKQSCVIELNAWDHSAELGTPKIEIYAADRFVALTGAHVVDTPTDCVDVSERIHGIIEANGSLDRSTGGEYTLPDGSDRGDDPPQVTGKRPTPAKRIIAALDRLRPGDIRLKSTVTNERGDGSRDLDPSWASSKSGTRLAELSDGWIYREGMVPLSALQVVALEERIITSVGDYPEGEQFWQAVEALRNRGADLPKRNPTKDQSTRMGP